MNVNTNQSTPFSVGFQTARIDFLRKWLEGRVSRILNVVSTDLVSSQFTNGVLLVALLEESSHDPRAIRNIMLPSLYTIRNFLA